MTRVVRLLLCAAVLLGLGAMSAMAQTFKPGQAIDNRMHAQGTNAAHINYAIDANYNRHPTLNDYFGRFDLRSAVTGGGDTQKRLGGITINPDGTYVWDVRGDGQNIIRGTWRQATPAYMMEYEGGPGIVLLRARAGHDYHARVNCTPGWEGDTWIEVGTGRGRQAVEFGLKLQLTPARPSEPGSPHASYPRRRATRATRSTAPSWPAAAPTGSRPRRSASARRGLCRRRGEPAPCSG
jgi:hypothetical protein